MATQDASAARFSLRRAAAKSTHRIHGAHAILLFQKKLKAHSQPLIDFFFLLYKGFQAVIKCSIFLLNYIKYVLALVLFYAQNSL